MVPVPGVEVEKMMKNYVYAVTTLSDSHMVDAEIRKSHQLRNELCAIELDRRNEINQALMELVPEYVSACQSVDDAEATLETLRSSIQAERVKQRTKKPIGIDSTVEEAKQVKESLKTLRQARKEQKQIAFAREDVRIKIEGINQQYKTREKEVLCESDVYWPTKGLVVQSCKSFRSGSPPRFKRWDGEGQLAVQLQGGMPCGEAYESDTRFYLEVPESLDMELRRRGKASKSLRKLACAYFRIGSKGRDPVFVRLGIAFHRHLPPGRIKWVYLERRMLANRVKYVLRLTIDCDEQELDVSSDDKSVAITLGWRMDKDGLRVARFQGSDGFTEQLKLPVDHLRDYETVANVQSDRKRRFNNRTHRLKQWIKVASKRYDLPEWLIESGKSMHAWKSEARLSGLISRWNGEHFEGDDLVFSLLRSWQKWDRKKWQHQRRLSVRIVRRRNDLFRLVAKRLAGRYKIAFLADLNAEQLSRNAEPEELTGHESAVHRHSKWAAVSTFASLVAEKFPSSTIKIDTHNIVKQCSQCGHVNRRPKTGNVIQCAGCHKTYSMSDNALANVHARGEVALKSGALLAIVEAQQLAAKKKADALSKMQEANRAARKRKRESLGA